MRGLKLAARLLQKMEAAVRSRRERTEERIMLKISQKIGAVILSLTFLFAAVMPAGAHEKKSSKTNKAKYIAGGAIAGVVIGGLVGGKKGALIGAAVGAGAGAAAAYGKDRRDRDRDRDRDRRWRGNRFDDDDWYCSRHDRWHRHNDRDWHDRDRRDRDRRDRDRRDRDDDDDDDDDDRDHGRRGRRRN